MTESQPDTNLKEEEKTGRIILTRDDVFEHVKKGEAGGHVIMVEMKDLLGERGESCVDGRGEIGVVGTPGGNAGELALYLDSYEKISGIKLTEEQVDKIFENYLKTFGKFYLHSDSHALQHMGVRSDDDLYDPSEEEKEHLLEQLTNPNNIGCGHLKLALKNPQEYGLNPDLIRYLLKSFFKKLWSKDKNVEFDILDGEHAEGAVLLVKVDAEEIGAYTQIPTISPRVEGTSTFVYHPQAVEFMRRESAKEVNTIIGGITGEQVDKLKFTEVIMTAGNRVLGETVRRLAKDEKGRPLPHFEVIFSQTGEVKSVEKV